MAAQHPIFKFDVFIYKNDQKSSEEFTKYMTEVYAPKAAPIVKRNGILQYAVMVTNPIYRERQGDFIKNKMKQPEWTVPDYDAIVSYWIRDPTDMVKLREDPEFPELEKDVPVIANTKLGHLLLGHQTLMFTSDEMPRPVLPISSA
ncbi:hypothetical protein N0V82_000161 [Gnomoniopsis sp. IMI 355080]|nr:hypothetical protein N0V82_000161 [Gnomoniopsis sp. IMI 355080]